MIVGIFFGIALLWVGMKIDLFQSCGHCWVFQICWHECNTLTPSLFRVINRSAGIPSPPLALCPVMLPKAHWTSHSRMSGTRWVITPSWLSRSLRPFFCTWQGKWWCRRTEIFWTYLRWTLYWKVARLSPLIEYRAIWTKPCLLSLPCNDKLMWLPSSQ